MIRYVIRSSFLGHGLLLFCVDTLVDLLQVIVRQS